jgi:hypothetical protein
MVSDTEELAQFYYEKLIDKDAQPAVVLSQFYSSFYNRSFDSKTISMFGHVIKLYGRNMAYLALLDLFDFEDVNHENIRRLYYYLIKRRMEGKFSIQENVDLTNVTKDYAKEMKKIRKQTVEGVEDPFDVE